MRLGKEKKQEQKQEPKSTDNATAATPTYGWIEIRPYFSTDNKIGDMLDILQKIDDFSFFIVRVKGVGDGVTRIFVKTKATNLPLFDAMKNAVYELAEERVFWCKYLAYLKMKNIHYALPIAKEVHPSIVYGTIEKINEPCLIAVTCKHKKESYSISSFAKRHIYREPSILNGLSSSPTLSTPKRRTFPQRHMYAQEADWKMRRRHFHCTIAISAADKEKIKTLLTVLSDDGLSIGRYTKEKNYIDKVKKPLLFNSRFCVLSDIELANIVALPSMAEADTKSLRLNYGTVKTFTSGPSVGSEGVNSDK